MEEVYWLSQITPLEQSLVGEKIFILSQLLQQGYPVLPGFAVSTAVLRQFLNILDDFSSTTPNLLDSSLHVNINDYRALESVAKKSRQTILDANFPVQWQEKLFASAQQLNAQSLILRPSLVIPHDAMGQDNLSLWRAQMCSCQPEALSVALKKVWAELFSAKSLFYWQKLGIGTEKLNLAVLVQPLQDAIASGTITIEPKTICIRATWGLGHSLLLGQVQPDVYQVERKTGKILRQQLGSKTFAYRLPSFLEEEPNSTFEQTNASITISQAQDYLESYFVDEREQNLFSLDNAGIERLTQLTEELLTKRPLIKHLEWMSVAAAQANNIPSFYLTQLNYYRASGLCQVYASPRSSLEKRQFSLTGLAASPGKVTATVRVMPQLELAQSEIFLDEILVTKSITPYQVIRFPKIKGIITETGGITSHGAIIARELGIPAVVGVAKATDLLQTGETVLLNGNTGEIYRLAEKMEGEGETRGLGDGEQITNFLLPNYPIATQLMVNLSQPSAIANAASLPVDGVGLVRSELMLLDLLSSRSLEEWLKEEQKLELLENITSLLRQFVATFTPRPVFYRSCDWRAAEFSATAKANPIGSRGTYQYLLDSTLFDLELEALARIRAEGYTNLHLILPFVRSVEEFSFCRHRVERVGLSERPSFQLWIMAEVPSVIFLLLDYVKAGVQGIAIGINDLTQLLLGVDREQAHFATRGLHSNHPAVVEAIAQLIDRAKTVGIPCSLCARAPIEYPSFVKHLVKCGITTISVEPEAVASTYQAIARAEQSLILEAARNFI